MIVLRCYLPQDLDVLVRSKGFACRVALLRKDHPDLFDVFSKSFLGRGQRVQLLWNCMLCHRGIRNQLRAKFFHILQPDGSGLEGLRERFLPEAFSYYRDTLRDPETPPPSHK